MRAAYVRELAQYPVGRRRLRSYRARLKVTATYPGAKAVSRSRQLTVRR